MVKKETIKKPIVKKSTKSPRSVKTKASVVAVVKQPITKTEQPIKSPKHTGYIMAVGRRKEAVARIRLDSGNGELLVNNLSLNQYFPIFEHQFIVRQPLKAADLEGKVNISIKVSGGGKAGQAEAVRHGIARVLIIMDPDLRKVLKPLGFLTRDARVKERKKPGLKKARRAPQWQKR